MSIDLGINEVAVAHLSKEINLLEWERVHLVSPRPYTPKACYEQVWNMEYGDMRYGNQTID